MDLRSRLRARCGTGLALVCCLLAGLFLLPRTGHLQSLVVPWSGYAHDVHHTAISSVASMPLLRIRWQTPVDLTNPDGEILIHYGSPLITAANTVLVPVRTTSANTFRMEAHNGATGALMWMQNTDYVLPPHDWTPPFSGVLASQPGPLRTRLYYQGIGGTVYYIDNPDTATNATVPTQIAFYGPHTAAFDNNVFINTPITADRYGDIYFGFQVT